MVAELLAPGLLGLAWLAGGAAGWLERWRVARLAALAADRGWTLTPRDDTWATAFTGPPFGRGSARSARDVLTGAYRGRDLVAFDYRSTSRGAGAGGPTARVRHWSVVVLRLPAPVPLVELGAAGRLRALRGGVAFESERFNARYRVRTDEPRLAHDLLPARTLQLLLERPPVSLRLDGGCAVSWRPGRLDPVELLARLDTVSAVLDGVPAWVWRDRG